MRHPLRMTRFETGKVYDRGQLHADAAAAGLRPGNANAGIVRVGDVQCIFWNPFRGLYANQWIAEPSEFVYSGEGSLGDMSLTPGNRALLEAEVQGLPVTTFYKIARTGSQWQCLGQYDVQEHHEDVSVDAAGVPRADLRFRLTTRLAAPPTTLTLPKIQPRSKPPLPDEAALWAAVDQSQQSSGGKRKRGKSSSKDKRQSDPLKTMYVLRRAVDLGGVCESCLTSPGWLDEDGLPHFQAHHVDADVDLVDWIGAVCGTCHDRLHHGADRVARGHALRAEVKKRQEQLGRPTS